MSDTAAVQIANPEDLVYVPDQPEFGLQNGVTVAAWFNPSSLTGVKTLVRKRDKGTSSFALLLNAGRFEFVVRLANNMALSVAAPQRARTAVFQHVTATYDGATARLYVDGVQVNSFSRTGSILPGAGPLLIGNDGSERRFAGTIDGAMFATHAITAAQVVALQCVHHEPPSFTVTPVDAVEALPGATIPFDIAITNHSAPICPAIQIELTIHEETGNLALFPEVNIPHLSDPVPPGTTGHFIIEATVSEIATPGQPLSFHTHVDFPELQISETVTSSVNVGEPTADGCTVRTTSELMITRTSVVDDPVRTTFAQGSTDPRNGVWTFKHLMEGLAPTPADASAMVEAMLSGMADSQVINGFTIAGRFRIRSQVLARWPRTDTGALDLAQAPLRLQAIVNRLDLRDLDQGNAGEGRFVFAFEQAGAPLQATMIFEYKLPAASESDVLAWANAFHGLGALPPGETYNAALQAITEQFAARGARPGHPNGSAINAVRTNEIPFGGSPIWELREFRLSPVTGLLTPVPLERTPSNAFDNTSTLSSFITQNQPAIIAEQHTVPEAFAGQPFLGGAVLNTLSPWRAPGADNLARHRFAINTCNGCHAPEAGVVFLQIEPRFAGSEATLAPFLTGTSVADPVSGERRTFNDLRRRRLDLESIVCSDLAARSLSGTSLRKGLDRVH